MIQIPHLLEWVRAVVASCFQFMMMMMMRSLLFLLWCLGVEPRDVVGRIVRSVRVKMSITLQDG